MGFKEGLRVFKKVSRVFYNFVGAWISSELPEQKEGLFDSVR